jgi:hypothetical protein
VIVLFEHNQPCFAMAIVTAPTPSNSNSPRADLKLGYIWMISVVAALGGLLFGWDWVVIGGAKPFFQR